MSNVTNEAIFYVCGPQRLIDGVQQAAIKLEISDTHIRFERFHKQDIEIELRRSSKTLTVDCDEAILNAIEKTRIRILSDCKVGNCGTCAVKVLEGSPQ